MNPGLLTTHWRHQVLNTSALIEVLMTEIILLTKKGGTRLLHITFSGEVHIKLARLLSRQKYYMLRPAKPLATKDK